MRIGHDNVMNSKERAKSRIRRDGWGKTLKNVNLRVMTERLYDL